MLCGPTLRTWSGDSPYGLTTTESLTITVDEQVVPVLAVGGALLWRAPDRATARVWTGLVAVPVVIAAVLGRWIPMV
ncbi:MAG: hypothetical protein MUF83_08670, partial [Acidimicrobiales bacterium]|nr:hypothetical protein [Acidimicrobiales bacterium]